MRLPGLIAALWLAVIAFAVPSPAFAESEAQQAFLKLQQGRTALLRGQYRIADQLLSEAIALPALPPDARAFALGHRGVARSYLGALRPAIHDFNAAIGLSPEDATLYNNRGNLLLEIGLFTEAARDFDQAIALAPDYGAAYNNRGNAMIMLRDYAEAIADFDRAIALMPLNAVPFNGRGRAALALGRPAGAMRDFSRAIALNNRYAQAYINRAEALVAIRRYPEAIADYGAAIELAAGSAQIYRTRASLYAALQMRGPALADLAEARRLDPSIVAVADSGSPLMSEADALVTAALPSPQAHPSPAHQPCTPQQTSSVATHQGLAKLAEASPSTLPASFIGSAQPDNEVAPGVAVYRTALHCGSNGDNHTEPLAQLASTGEDASALAANAWRLERTHEGTFIATHPEHAGLRLRLEMYGTGEPELLHWQDLSDTLGRIGLLHYRAGVSTKGEILEYVALIDAERDRLLSIEPVRWGEKHAVWTWSETDLVVVDPQGVPSRVQLDGQLTSKLKLNGREFSLANHQWRHRTHAAKRPRQRATPFAKAKAPKRWQPYAMSAHDYAQRVPPRFRRRGGGYAYNPYR